MAGKFDTHAFSQGDIMRRQAETERALRDQQTARRLEAASVGQGGLRVHRGGQFVLDDTDGARSFTAAPTGIFVHNGASINALDGGSIRALYESGTTAALWGSLVNTSSGSDSGHGILIQGADEADIFRALRRPDGLTAVFIGTTANDVPVPVDQFIVRADRTRINSYAADGLRLDAFDAAGNIDIYAQDGGYVWLSSDDFEIHTAYETTAEAANCYLAEDGQIHRVSSSRRLKDDIQDLELDPDRVLRLQPRTWIPSAEVTGGGLPPGAKPRSRPPRPRSTRRQVGFVAEEVADAGLDQFVTRDGQGQPDGISYDRLSAALLTVVQRQERQITELTARVSSLEASHQSDLA